MSRFDPTAEITLWRGDRVKRLRALFLLLQLYVPPVTFLALAILSCGTGDRFGLVYAALGFLSFSVKEIREQFS